MKKRSLITSLSAALVLSLATPHTTTASDQKSFFKQKIEQGRDRVNAGVYTLYTHWQNFKNKGKSGVRRRVDNVKGSVEAQMALVGFVGVAIAYALEVRAYKRLKENEYIIAKLAEEHGEEAAKVRAAQIFADLSAKSEELHSKEQEIKTSVQEISSLRAQAERLRDFEQRAKDLSTQLETTIQSMDTSSQHSSPGKSRSPRLNPFGREKRDSQEQKRKELRDSQEQKRKELLTELNKVLDDLKQLSPEGSQQLVQESSWAGRIYGSLRRTFSRSGGSFSRPTVLPRNGQGPYTPASSASTSSGAVHSQ